MTNAIERAKELLATKTHNWLRLDADLTECQEVLDIVSDLVGELEKANKEAIKQSILRKEADKFEGLARETISELRKTRFQYFSSEECWIYSEGEENYLSTLVCPVVISAALLLDMEEALSNYRSKES